MQCKKKKQMTKRGQIFKFINDKIKSPLLSCTERLRIIAYI